MIALFDKDGERYVLDDNLILELKFLRYFYNEASDYMGPSDGDIYHYITKHFYGDHKKLPSGYGNLISYRVWPDGTVQEVDEADAYSYKSDDFVTIEAFDEEDALVRAKIDA